MAKVQIKIHPFDCFVSLTFLAAEVEVVPALRFVVQGDLNLRHVFPLMAVRLVAAG